MAKKKMFEKVIFIGKLDSFLLTKKLSGNNERNNEDKLVVNSEKNGASPS